ncbi:DEAD/DEAH box helicase family protein [Rossellomorea sp. BNER]|uniref:DEAD/DEAH box helicase family protein n=1 Tax=Rossellomorea sp. BNER TaxID=2962031 RepID=UPI003AF2A7F3|nr:DEAD/DEAH box helicase family protein [Rossellomorea sp. BNER]
MNTFPKDISFIYDWRTYQHRVLSSLEEHLQNRHLHLIAPPGSGKTVLGLEVMLRLNEPTLILAPTLAIKNQWLERFVDLFLNQNEAPDWVSMDLKNPKFLTITTYQSLHSVFSKDADKEEDIVDEMILEVEKQEPEKLTSFSQEALQSIEQVGFKTLILDEAHHLRTAWWKSTLQFRDRLSQPNIVALTATPPYDVSLAEWDRYIELCGPIDLEISVPELVKEQDLCPHQDYIYFSGPSLEESEIIQSFRDNVSQVRKRLVENSGFVHMLKEHPWIIEPDHHIESILASPAYFSSLLIFLKEAEEVNWKDYIHILGTKRESVPKLDLDWLETLLTGCIYKDPYTQGFDEVIKDIKKWLSRIGAIDRKKVYLRSTKKIDRMLLTSVSKLRSINEIVQYEANTLKDDLRLVILTDYIRLADLPRNAEDEKELTRLGVIHIFETLRRNKMANVKLGVLSGSVVILPKSSIPALDEIISCEIKETLRITPLQYDDQYVSIRMNGSHSQQLVRVMTELFTAGEIHVLTGTTALLGEGWDAPSINSMILASYVGTFMLSNQMRGRAIRVQRGNDNKSSTIWHLVCMDPSQKEAGYDMDTLSRRFKAFVGVSHTGDYIENGIDRLNLELSPLNATKLQNLNLKMFEHAGRRSALSIHWREAIDKSDSLEMVEELKATPESLPKSSLFMNTIKALIMQGLMFGLFLFAHFLEEIAYLELESFLSFVYIVLFALFISVIFMLPKTIKGLWLWIRNGRLETSSKQLGEAVLQTLHQMNLIKTDLEEIELKVAQEFNGYINFWVNGGTRYEQTLILEAVQEVQDPIDNPRYFIKRKSKWGPFLQYDYHAVPQIIARNKKGAEFFHQQWKKRIGKADLIYARTLEGRQELIKARMKSLSAAFVKKTKRVTAWR